MTKKKGIFEVNINNPFLPTKQETKKRNDMKIETALSSVIRQMEVGGSRERTIHDYRTIVYYFIRDTGILYLQDITSDSIYKWLDGMSVKNTTKLTRLKCFKAFLGRCFDNGWLSHKFWRNVNIKVDYVIKEGATDKDVQMLMSVLDYTNFLDLRNGTAVLLAYTCGLRIGTISRMRESHIDLESKMLFLDGEVMKNRQGLILPLSDQLVYLLGILIKQNEIIRREYKKDNDYVFITIKGNPTKDNLTSNSIQRQLRKYTLQFGINNITFHALRRGFARNLYNKSNDILLVSKALSHNDLSVTTKYLHAEMNDVADKLKDYL